MRSLRLPQPVDYRHERSLLGESSFPHWPRPIEILNEAKPPHPIHHRSSRLSGILDAGPARHPGGGGPVGLPVCQLTVTSSYLV
jgi:hypothetical protein